MIKEADTSSPLTAREDASEKKRSALRLVSTRHLAPVEDEPASVATESRSLPSRAIHRAFLVRDERFIALHPRRVFSRQRRRGSYVFHCQLAALASLFPPRHRRRRSAADRGHHPTARLALMQIEHVSYAPPGYHLPGKKDQRLALSVDPAVNYLRSSIDVLFDSAAAFCGRLPALLRAGPNSLQPGEMARHAGV